MTTPVLSIVAPLFDEERIVEELARRCEAAARETGVAFELLFADDASRDATPAHCARLAGEGRVRHVRLDANRGQFGATQAGLAAARGEWVVVLDGDLQDPPETIPRLFDAIRAAPAGTDGAFAVKATRDDPAWFTVGRLGYHAFQRLFAPVRIPSGAGSYSIMSASLAAKVASVPPQRSNISAVLVALGARCVTVPYEKAARYDGRSRVGLRGLVREALASLLLTGALTRVVFLLALPPLFAGAIIAAEDGRSEPAMLFGLALLVADGARTLAKRRERLLATAPLSGTRAAVPAERLDSPVSAAAPE